MKTNQPDWMNIVREKVEGLRYGVVQIVVHDSRVYFHRTHEKDAPCSPRARNF